MLWESDRRPLTFALTKHPMGILHLRAVESSFAVQVETGECENRADRFVSWDTRIETLRHIGVDDVLQDEAGAPHRVDI
jgi:hypothetical protein